MKSTPLKRGKPLRRKAWLRSRSKTSSYRRRPRDLDRMRWIKRQPCAARGVVDTLCCGRVEADHAGERGLGQKADDDTCIPLCQQHHRERTDRTGGFASWSRTKMRAWLVNRIRYYQHEYVMRDFVRGVVYG